MRRPVVYMLVAALLSGTVTGVLALAVALRANAESDQKWCSVVVTMTESYDRQPPVTAAGRQLASDLRGLRDQLGCPRS